MHKQSIDNKLGQVRQQGLPTQLLLQSIAQRIWQPLVLANLIHGWWVGAGQYPSRAQHLAEQNKACGQLHMGQKISNNTKLCKHHKQLQAKVNNCQCTLLRQLLQLATEANTG